MAEQDDRRRHRVALWCFVVLAAAGCLVSWHLVTRPADGERLVAADTSSTGDTSGQASGNGKAVLVPAAGDRRATFVVRVGDVDGLYPSARKPLPVTLYNPQRYGIRVYRMQVTGTSLTAGCASSHLGTGTYRVSIILRPRATYSTHLNLGLRPTATDACQGARWRVTVQATAVKR